MAGLTVKIGADTTLLGRGLGMAENAIGKFSKKVGSFGLGALTAGTAALGAGFIGAAAGIKQVLDVGGRLSDVSANTGLLAGEVAVMEKAFSDAGLSIGNVPKAVNKMQRSIVDASEGNQTIAESFERLGLSLTELRTQSPAKQFETIAAALSAVEDPAERTARAMEIFGKSGASLGAVFADPKAFANASATLGDQAKILNENAAIFDRASDLLGSIGTKLQGLFAGMAEKITPTLLAVLEELNKIDLAKYGQAVGEVVAVLAEAFSSGKIPELLKLGLLGAAQKFSGEMVRGVVSYGAALGELFRRLPAAMMEAVKMLADANLWKGIASAAYGAFSKMLVDLLGMLPKGLREAIPGMDDFLTSGRGVAAGALTDSKQFLAQATAGLRDEFAGIPAAMGAAFEDAYRTMDDPFGAEETRGRMKDIIDGLRENVRLLGEKTREDFKGAAKVMTGEGRASMAGQTARLVTPELHSLARVGGARGSAALYSLDAKRNDILIKIEANTRGKRAAVYA